MRYVLACDLGGTNFRAALVTETGQVMHVTSVAMPISVDRYGASEVDPQDWWRVFGQTLDVLAESAGFAFDMVERSQFPRSPARRSSSAMTAGFCDLPSPGATRAPKQ